MKNYTKTNVGTAARTELHDALSLTGAEVSINQLPAGAGVPFVHSHKHNEEIYGVISGSGKAVIDGETVPLTAGDWLSRPRRKAPVLRSRRVRHYFCLHSGEGKFAGRLHRRRRCCVLNEYAQKAKSGNFSCSRLFPIFFFFPLDSPPTS